MDFGLHEVTERCVDKTLGGDPVDVVELPGNDHKPEVPSTSLGSSMTGMAITQVDQFDNPGVEPLFQCGRDGL